MAVGSADKINKSFSNHRVVRLRNAVLMPGLVNIHSHLELPPLLDAIKGASLPDWIINLLRVKKGLSSTDYKHAVINNLDTLIRTGTTTVGEICTHGASPALLKLSGLRAVVYHEIISMDPGRGENMVLPPQTYSRHLSTMQTGFSPHAPYTVSQAVLKAIGRLSRKKGIRLAMHIAESEDEIRLLQGKKSGLEKLYSLAGWDLDWAPQDGSSIEYLNRIGILSPRLLAVHAVHVTKNDIELIRKSKVSVAHCPRSNKETGAGKMPLKKFLDAGVIVGLGTDSLASSASLNMWDEMRYAYQIHRRSGISAENIFGLATTGGAKALCLDKEIGAIEPGKKADIIAVPLPNKDTGDLYCDLLRETKSCIMSMVNGIILTNQAFDSSRENL
jgi:5-methylthioadenosine/S-adenosylhomocysteine deaminase